MTAFNVLLTRCSTPVAPWYIVPADDKPFRDWAVSRILLETLRAMNPRVPMPKLNVPSLVRQLAGGPFTSWMLPRATGAPRR